jgi:hypothetical protein
MSTIINVDDLRAMVDDDDLANDPHLLKIIMSAEVGHYSKEFAAELSAPRLDESWPAQRETPAQGTPGLLKAFRLRVTDESLRQIADER